jgi:hypothetical protein
MSRILKPGMTVDRTTLLEVCMQTEDPVKATSTQGFLVFKKMLRRFSSSTLLLSASNAALPN